MVKKMSEGSSDNKRLKGRFLSHGIRSNDSGVGTVTVSDTLGESDRNMAVLKEGTMDSDDEDESQEGIIDLTLGVDHRAKEKKKKLWRNKTQAQLKS